MASNASAMGQTPDIRQLVEMLRASNAGVPIQMLQGKLPIPRVENAPPFPQMPHQVLPQDKPPPPKQMKSVLKRE